MRIRSRYESLALVLLRTAIGWHFLYEGYYKLLVPGWTRTGEPLRAWSAGGYLKAATGPFATLFHSLAESQLIGWVDILIPLALLLVGLSLMLGWFTQLGAWGALALLTLFYLPSIPMTGSPMPGSEGTYLIVNKTLVEWVAALLVLVARTGEIAGLDLFRSSTVRVRSRLATPPEAVRPTP